jgi:hypothetical protein
MLPPCKREPDQESEENMTKQYSSVCKTVNYYMLRDININMINIYGYATI